MVVEYVWFALPICALFWQLGGTFNKVLRRIGVPALLCFAWVTFCGWSPWLPVVFAAYFGAFCLPFTLIGDSVHDSWINWIWIWIIGFIWSVPCEILALVYGGWQDVLIAAGVSAVIIGIFGTLSNIKGAAEMFVWKFCEGIFGFFVAFPMAALIQTLKG